MSANKVVLTALGVCLTVVLTTGDAFAFSCPRLIKAADASITKAETKATDMTGKRKKGRAMAMIELAKLWKKEATADHKDGKSKKSAQAHYRSEAKAKAAKALADLVK